MDCRTGSRSPFGKGEDFEEWGAIEGILVLKQFIDFEGPGIQ